MDDLISASIAIVFGHKQFNYVDITYHTNTGIDPIYV